MTAIDCIAFGMLFAITMIVFIITRRKNKELLSLFDSITDDAKADTAKKGRKGLQP